jgi:hypothetical protein
MNTFFRVACVVMFLNGLVSAMIAAHLLYSGHFSTGIISVALSVISFALWGLFRIPIENKYYNHSRQG